MPVYRCNTPAGALSQDQRNRIAQAFTEVHCSITNAPRHFVQVWILAERSSFLKGVFQKLYGFDQRCLSG